MTGTNHPVKRRKAALTFLRLLAERALRPRGLGLTVQDLGKIASRIQE
jgi:hypothetical protein